MKHFIVSPLVLNCQEILNTCLKCILSLYICCMFMEKQQKHGVARFVSLEQREHNKHFLNLILFRKILFDSVDCDCG